MAENSEYILELLQSYGMITEEQVDAGWKKVAESDGDLDIVDCLKQLGYVDEDELMAMLAQQYGMETLDLSGYQIQPEVIEMVPPHIAKQYNVIPVMKHEDTLTVAMSDPTDMNTIDSLRYLLKMDVDAVISPKDQIKKLIDHHMGSMEEQVDSIMGDLASADELTSGLMSQLEAGAEGVDEEDTPIIKLVSLIIVEAFKMRASDIHLEPLEKKYRVRYRIDGMLTEMESPPKYLQGNITSRLKIMAKLDISEKRVPQDGRIQVKVLGKDIDLRVSSIPTSHGESIVMRILDKASIQLDIPKLGFFSDDQKMIDKILAMPDGIFLVTGPTGSGKTTSLYAFLNSINTPNRKIITAEDPVEYQLGGINQVQITAKIGMTFAKALRAMLRQAPNIIMVGEIRDIETGAIAVEAALTGHLVFSTLHTNDAPGAITRLIDMGVKPFLVASGVKAVMAQRLVRRICKNCAEPTTPTVEELAGLELPLEYFKEANLMRGKGCQECGGKGFRGRMGVYELFMMSTEIQELIFKNEPSTVIKEAARRAGMRTLRDDALRKAMAGMTTLGEVIRVSKTDEE